MASLLLRIERCHRGVEFTLTPIHKDSYDIRIEKLLVDMFANSLLQEFVSASDIEYMVDDIFSTYVVNTKTVLAYAKRES